MVIGSRYLHGVSVVNWPLHRIALSAAANRYVRAITGAESLIMPWRVRFRPHVRPRAAARAVALLPGAGVDGGAARPGGLAIRGRWLQCLRLPASQIDEQGEMLRAQNARVATCRKSRTCSRRPW